MRRLDKDYLIRTALYALSLCFVYMYWFIDDLKWNDLCLVYLYCGFIFLVSLMRVLLKRKRSSFEQMLPIVNMFLAIPAGYNLDFILRSLVLFKSLSSSFLAYLLLTDFFLIISVCVWTLILLGLIFWKDILKEK